MWPAFVHEIDRAHSPRMSLTDGNPNDKLRRMARGYTPPNGTSVVSRLRTISQAAQANILDEPTVSDTVHISASFLASHDDHEIAAEAFRAVLECVVDRGAERQAVAGAEAMDRGAFVKGQGAVEDPDLLMDERVRHGGKRDAGAGRELDFGELQQAVAGRRDRAPAVAGLRVLPALLLRRAGEA